MKTLILTVAACALVSTGCSKSETETMAPAPAAAAASGATAIKRYPIHGKVLAINVEEKSAKIDADAIGDWMGAMAMNYPFKDPADLKKLTVGSVMDATVTVDGDNFFVSDVK